MSKELSPSFSTCRFIAKANKHPANRVGSFAHGRVTEVVCYACTAEKHVVFLFDTVMGVCENHNYTQTTSLKDGPPNYTTSR